MLCVLDIYRGWRAEYFPLRRVEIPNATRRSNDELQTQSGILSELFRYLSRSWLGRLLDVDITFFLVRVLPSFV
jgi:hypothetical protein